jgi:hypothetical protein
MTQLDASFQSSGRAVNLVEPGDLVDIVFTTPPQQASNVNVELWEAAGPGDTVQSDRLIATFRGQINSGKFKLDGPSNDPLDPDPNKPNPVIANFSRSSAPPVFRVRFKDDPTESKIPLPDTEEENGSYEMKLKASGSVGGSNVAFAGTAILNLRVWQDVMIVPDTDAATPAQRRSPEFVNIFADSAAFAKQWRKFAGARRQILPTTIDGTLADFERTVTAAAAKAHKGDIILFTGHGGAGGFRGLSNSVFDTTPASVHGVSSHPNAITSDVLNLPNLATRGPAGNWIANDKISTDAQAKVNALAPRWEMLSRLGAVLKQNAVARFIVLACNMGKDASFGFSLAKLLQTTVGGYTSLIAANQVVFTQPGKPSQTLVQVWLMSSDSPPAPGTQDPNQPPSGDANDPSFHEIPGGLKSFNP